MPLGYSATLAACRHAGVVSMDSFDGVDSNLFLGKLINEYAIRLVI